MSRATAGDRLRRVLALVPWLSANSPASVDEVCSRFAISRSQLLSDLEVLPYVGVPPYSPDAMIEVDLNDDQISIRLAEPFDRPLRLTPTQALALIAAGYHVRQVPGADQSDPLQRALTKLAAALGVDPAQVHIELGESDQGVRESLVAAIAQGRQVEIDHYVYGRDERSTRKVDPYQVVADQGSLYLVAWCHRSEGVRTFRLDRISEVRITDQEATPPPDDLPWERYRPGAEALRVTIELAPEARWVIDRYPYDHVEDLDGGGARVTLGVSARPWLERLLLGLGPQARLVEAPDSLADAGTAIARRMLARYASGRHDEESSLYT